MGDLWGIGGFRGGGRANRKKKSEEKSQKLRKNQKNFFLTGNGLKSIGNLTYPNRLGGPFPIAVVLS